MINIETMQRLLLAASEAHHEYVSFFSASDAAIENQPENWTAWYAQYIVKALDNERLDNVRQSVPRAIDWSNV